IRLLLSEPGCEYRGRVEAALEVRGARLDPRIEIGTLVGLKHAVQAGLGAALLPALPFVAAPPGTVMRELADVDILLPIGIVRREETGFASPALNLLLERIRDAMAEALPSAP